MNSVGIDVSKGKSTVVALRPMGEVALPPTEYLHTEIELEKLAYTILALGEDTRVVMEATGRYHEPVATALHEYGIYVCVLNPILIHQSGGGSIRKVKSDKKDAIKIAKYGLDNWVNLREYTPVDALRQQLKLFSRQYNLYMKNSVALSNNLISLTDKVFRVLTSCSQVTKKLTNTGNGLILSKLSGIATAFLLSAKKHLLSVTVNGVSVRGIISVLRKPLICTHQVAVIP